MSKLNQLIQPECLSNLLSVMSQSELFEIEDRLKKQRLFDAVEIIQEELIERSLSNLC